MKKVIFIFAMVLMVSGLNAQDLISNGESMYSIRKKLNEWKLEYDSLSATLDSIINGTKSIDLEIDTLTNTDKKIIIDTALIVPEISANAISVGEGTDLFSIARNGNFTLIGEAEQFEDVRIEPVARTTGVNAPTFEKYIDDGGGSTGVFLYSFTDAVGGSEKEVYFTMQMPHAWNQDSIAIHVHWIPAVSLATSTPRWALEYTWVEPSGIYSATTKIYAVGNVQGATSLVANTHYITAFTTINASASQDGLSSILIGRLYRDSGNIADTYNANKVGLLYIDCHIRLNSIGSDLEYTK